MRQTNFFLGGSMIEDAGNDPQQTDDNIDGSLNLHTTSG